jgi:hypothetical protein
MGRGFAITEYAWQGCAGTYRVMRTRHGRPWWITVSWIGGDDKSHGRVLDDTSYRTPTSAQSACYRHDRECEAVQAALTFVVRWMRDAEMLDRVRKLDSTMGASTREWV